MVERAGRRMGMGETPPMLQQSQRAWWPPGANGGHRPGGEGADGGRIWHAWMQLRRTRDTEEDLGGVSVLHQDWGSILTPAPSPPCPPSARFVQQPRQGRPGAVQGLQGRRASATSQMLCPSTFAWPAAAQALQAAMMWPGDSQPAIPFCQSYANNFDSAGRNTIPIGA